MHVLLWSGRDHLGGRYLPRDHPPYDLIIPCREGTYVTGCCQVPVSALKIQEADPKKDPLKKFAAQAIATDIYEIFAWTQLVRGGDADLRIRLC